MKLEDNVEPEVLLNHLRTSLANAQDTIKFMDTKTGFLTGLVSVTFAFPFVLGQYFVGTSFDIARWRVLYEMHPALSISVSGAFVWSIACGVASIYCSLVTIIARPPTLWRKPVAQGAGRYCILFPFHTAAHVTHAREYYAKITKGLTNQELLSEYEFQIEQLGGIVERKMCWHRRAATLFVLQLVFPAVIMVPVGMGQWLAAFARRTLARILDSGKTALTRLRRKPIPTAFRKPEVGPPKVPLGE